MAEEKSEKSMTKAEAQAEVRRARSEARRARAEVVKAKAEAAKEKAKNAGARQVGGFVNFIREKGVVGLPSVLRSVPLQPASLLRSWAQSSHQP